MSEVSGIFKTCQMTNASRLSRLSADKRSVSFVISANEITPVIGVYPKLDLRQKKFRDTDGFRLYTGGPANVVSLLKLRLGEEQEKSSLFNHIHWLLLPSLTARAPATKIR